MNNVECFSSDEQWLHDGCHLHEAAEMLLEKAGGNPYEAMKRFWTHTELIETYGQTELFFELNEMTITTSRYSLNDVVRMTGVPYHRLHYAICTGQIPMPTKSGRTRMFTEMDVEKVKEHFRTKKEVTK